MPYADLDTVKKLLDLADANPDDAADIARVGKLDAEMSRAMELKTGRAWGTPAPPPEARVVQAPHGGPGYATPDLSPFWVWGQDILPLPWPVRSVTSVVMTGDAAETIDAADYVLWQRTREGDHHAIKRVDGGAWPRRDGRSVITVTAIWSDMAAGIAAPVEIVEAVNFLVIEQFRLERTSPAGEVGPEGSVVRARNPWKFEVVRCAIERYRAALPVPGF